MAIGGMQVFVMALLSSLAEESLAMLFCSYGSGCGCWAMDFFCSMVVGGVMGVGDHFSLLSKRGVGKQCGCWWAGYHFFLFSMGVGGQCGCWWADGCSKGLCGGAPIFFFESAV